MCIVVIVVGRRNAFIGRCLKSFCKNCLHRFLLNDFIKVKFWLIKTVIGAIKFFSGFIFSFKKAWI